MNSKTSKPKKRLSRLVFTDVIMKAYEGALNEYRSKSKNADGSPMTQLDVANILNLTDDKIISKIERFIQGMDDRTFTVFVLATDNHAQYKLIQRKTKARNPRLILEPPTPAVIAQYRNNIEGLSSAMLSEALGLHSGTVGKYESLTADAANRRSPSAHTWTLMLLVTNQHPNYKIVARD